MAFLEIWLPPNLRTFFREKSGNPEGYVPHITFVRPFSFDDEKAVMEAVAEVGQTHNPFWYTLTGLHRFPQGIEYVGVGSPDMRALDSALEKRLSGVVTFKKRFDTIKNFHVTVSPAGDEERVELSDNVMESFALRITAVRDDKIWFGYDLFKKRLLSREEMLDKRAYTDALTRALHGMYQDN